MFVSLSTSFRLPRSVRSPAYVYWQRSTTEKAKGEGRVLYFGSKSVSFDWLNSKSLKKRFDHLEMEHVRFSPTFMQCFEVVVRNENNSQKEVNST